MATIEISPTSIDIEVGATTQLTAAAKTASGSTLARTFSWTSTDPARATVSANGLVTGVATGSGIVITASVDGRSGSATASVRLAPVNTITVSLIAATLLPGQMTTATAHLKDASGNALSGRTVAWTSSNTAIATVDAGGLVTALAAGPVQITATSEGKSGTAALIVIPPPVAFVSVSLGTPTLSVGTTVQSTVVTRDAGGIALTGRTVSYFSSAPAVASVSSAGLVTAIGVGSTTITATSEGVTGSAALTVTPRLAEWTVMVFLAADNNLAGAGIQDLDEMEALGSTPGVKVVVQAEYSAVWLKDLGVTTPSQINRPNWNTFRYLVPSVGSAPSVPGPNASAEDIGDRDMTSPLELRNFVDWAQQTAPAKRYLLVLWNHGNGPGRPPRRRDLPSGRLMSLSDLRQALSGRTPIDMIDFDMCLMGAYETVVALRGVARTAVFSEEVVPGDGNDYREILRTMQQNTTVSTTQMAGLLVDAFFTGYSGNTRPSLTKSAVSIEQSDAIVAATSALGTHLSTILPASATTISLAVASAQNYESPYLRDLGNAADSLRRRSSDPTLTARIDAVRAALADQSFLLRNRFRQGSSGSANNVSRSRGLSILWPSGSASDALPAAGEASLGAYQSQFPSESWSAFLGSFLSASARVPTVDLGANPLQAYLIWSGLDAQAGVDIDLLVFEPTLTPGLWDIYAPFLGTVSANGLFTPDSYDSELPLEGWSARRFVAKGKYYFFAWLFDDPTNVRPFVNVYSRFGYTTSFMPLYQTGGRPRLSLGFNWLDDANLTFTKLFADSYSDMRPVATWDLTNAATVRIGLSAGSATMGLAPRTAEEAAPSAHGDDLPRITPEQRRTLQRLAREHRLVRRHVSPQSRSGLLRDLQATGERR
ncbi:MAG: Ig-like domain-containing protein [Gemmatimonadetes bacterium]|nr:Ig-like domain-containing protein [Gemmatimonadota bacterium]